MSTAIRPSSAPSSPVAAPAQRAASAVERLPHPAPTRRTTPVGTRLRISVERALADLTDAGAAAELVAGLAWTAALGETCRITGPVADVRRALTAIAGGDEPQARAALVAAMDTLCDR